MFPAERIVCLTEETVETLYLLGEERRIVGISGYVVRPPRARREKPRVSTFTSADVPKILDLRPDLVLTFSDLQADIAATLIRHGIEVHAFNQRTVPQILDMIKTLGSLISATDRAERLAHELAASVVAAREQAAQLPRRPKVYFEEWDDPMISGIGWVSELVEVAGGPASIQACVPISALIAALQICDTAPYCRRAGGMILHRIAVIRYRITHCGLSATERASDEPRTSVDGAATQEDRQWIAQHRSNS
jgi:ABC-type Fe3+-hydroxamate transport system substrate-binding protein